MAMTEGGVSRSDVPPSAPIFPEVLEDVPLGHAAASNAMHRL